jgi:hypothetical protein
MFSCRSASLLTVLLCVWCAPVGMGRTVLVTSWFYLRFLFLLIQFIDVCYELYGLATLAGSLDLSCIIVSKMVRERKTWIIFWLGFAGGGLGASDSRHCVYRKTTGRTGDGCAGYQTVPICPSVAGWGRYSSKFLTTIQLVPHRQHASYDAIAQTGQVMLLQ